MPEWPNGRPWKGRILARVSWVRIPPSPQRTKFPRNFYVAETFNFRRKLLRFAILMFYTYILQSLKNKSLYIGYTTDLKKRFGEHNDGKSLATKPFRPYKLIFYEAFIGRKDAKAREEYLKSGWGFRSIKKMLKSCLN